MIKYILVYLFFIMTAQAQFVDLPQANLNGLTTDDLDEGVVNLYGSSAILTSSVNGNTADIVTITTFVDLLAADHVTYTSSIQINSSSVLLNTDAIVSNDAEIATITATANDAVLMSVDQTITADKTLTGSWFSTYLDQNVATSTDIISAANNNDYSQYNEKNSGFLQWTSGADASTWTLSGSDFTVDRSGEGFINGKLISWEAGQTVAALSNNNVHFIYIDTDGLIQSRTSFIPASDPYSDYIVLFLVLMADADADVARDNHDYSKDIQIARYLHKNVGIVVQNSGVILSRYLTGTGTSTGDRALSVTSGTLDDSGLETTVTATDFIDVHEWYINPSAWREHSHGTNEISMVYNNAGAVTSLGVGKRGVVTLFSTKDNIEDTSGVFFALMGTAQYNNLAAAQAAIAEGNNTSPTGYLTKFDLCQLGHLIILNNADGGYIESVIVERDTFNSTYGGGNTNSHSLLTDLDADDHTQYLLLAGRTGGQIVTGTVSISGQVDMTGTASVAGQIGTSSQLLLRNSGYYTAIQPYSSLAVTYSLILPPDDGDADEVLKTDGSGVLDWVAQSGSGGLSVVPVELTAGGDAPPTGECNNQLLNMLNCTAFHKDNNQDIVFQQVVPSSYTPGDAIRLEVKYSGTSTSDVHLVLTRALLQSDDLTYIDPFTNSSTEAFTVTLPTTTGFIATSTVLAITTDGNIDGQAVTARDLMPIRIQRWGSHASDTSTGYFNIHSIGIDYNP